MLQVNDLAEAWNTGCLNHCGFSSSFDCNPSMKDLMHTVDIYFYSYCEQ